MLIQGNCKDILKEHKDNSIDLIVTDPPYGISFMGKDWDKALPDKEVWQQCYRVLKEGKLAFVMCSPRQDVLSRMIISLEDTGFRTNYTSIYWTYASGFPKAANVSKLIDKKAGVKREVIGKYQYPIDQPKRRQLHGGGKPKTDYGEYEGFNGDPDITKPATEEAKKMEGAYIGFQPKPAVEVILVVSKGKTLTWLDDCRIPYQSDSDKWGNMPKGWSTENNNEGWRREAHLKYNELRESDQKGRFPANLLVSDDVLNDGKITKSNGHFPKVTGDMKNDSLYKGGHKIRAQEERYFNDSGSYSRYFSLDVWKTFPFIITPKASKSERNSGLENREPIKVNDGRQTPIDNPFQRGETLRTNTHPTVKPLKLFSYLITMGSREGDTVLDPFVGSGTSYIAATQLHRKAIGIEINPDYIEIAKARVKPLLEQTRLFIDEPKKNE